MKFSGYNLIIILFTFVGIISNVLAGTCREAQLCCNGRDSSCVVQKAPINAIIEDISDKPCYCDHACLKLEDCCSDFKAYCGVIDCQVSEWGPWSECNITCGTGIMSRNRIIKHAPQNGGKHCPSLEQTRGCQGYRCHGHKDKKVLREVALLLPAAFSKIRHANESNDIRRNLRLRYEDAYRYNREHEYCVEFEVLKATKSCYKLTPFNQLLEGIGESITVRCDLEALISDTSSISSSSNQSNKTEITNNSSILDENEKSNLITSKSTKKYRCRGEGLPGRTTRWSALPDHTCRGKWMRLSVKPKICTKSQFIFV